MGRIRTIKPEFPLSESMGRVSRESRYCFILLWTIADDSGRIRGSSRVLASLLYPFDDDAKTVVDVWLEELDKEGCIIVYYVDNVQHVQITKWTQHQKIERPTPSRLPDISQGVRRFTESSPSPHRVLGVPTLDLGPRTLDQNTGGVGENESKPNAKPAVCPISPSEPSSHIVEETDLGNESDIPEPPKPDNYVPPHLRGQPEPTPVTRLVGEYFNTIPKDVTGITPSLQHLSEIFADYLAAGETEEWLTEQVRGRLKSNSPGQFKTWLNRQIAERTRKAREPTRRGGKRPGQDNTEKALKDLTDYLMGDSK